ncbi:hypothetical protein O7607_14465 [Micromonospora sp. WMMA1949]|uniref:hypothetical protein n=1 Tax=Micromonospora sp. WMMA1949 TaxID=3015162 RepID=UPI0022B72E05|nr:hypothetical protein [Micromonospora sp. WMMA1949]MCZ7426935.1 hypothetical protein [Micromonospora sp. WMMA1949]
MRRFGLSSELAGRWDGLVVHAERPSRPGLRVEAAGGRRLLIRQADRVVLLGRQRACALGVFYARTGLYRSPLPPVAAAHPRLAAAWRTGSLGPVRDGSGTGLGHERQSQKLNSSSPTVAGFQ